MRSAHTQLADNKCILASLSDPPSAQFVSEVCWNHLVKFLFFFFFFYD